MKGGGSMDAPGAFCVQQAVSKAIGLPKLGDNPSCVGNAVTSFGIALNDREWYTDKARAKGMRRFAIAELGSNKLNQREFKSLLVKMWNEKYGWEKYENEKVSNDHNVRFIDEIPNVCNGDDQLTDAAEMATKVLIKMKSPGARYLRFLKRKKKAKVAPTAIPHFTSAGNRMTWREYGAPTAVKQGCPVK